MLKIILFSNGTIGELIYKILGDVEDIDVVLHVTEEPKLNIEKSNIFNFDYRKDSKLEFLDNYKFDIILVYSWRYKFSKFTLEKYSIYNLHPSLLPQYRGALPIVFQILFNESESGVTLHKMDEGFDTGPIYKQEKFKISSFDTMATLSIKIIKAIKKLILAFALDYNNGELQTIPQLEEESSYYGFKDLEQFIITRKTSYEELVKIYYAFGDKLPLKFNINGQTFKVISFSGQPTQENQFYFKLMDREIFLKLE